MISPENTATSSIIDLLSPEFDAKRIERRMVKGDIETVYEATRRRTSSKHGEQIPVSGFCLGFVPWVSGCCLSFAVGLGQKLRRHRAYDSQI